MRSATTQTYTPHEIRGRLVFRERLTYMTYATRMTRFGDKAPLFS